MKSNSDLAVLNNICVILSITTTFISGTFEQFDKSLPQYLHENWFHMNQTQYNLFNQKSKYTIKHYQVV